MVIARVSTREHLMLHTINSERIMFSQSKYKHPKGQCNYLSQSPYNNVCLIQPCSPPAVDYTLGKSMPILTRADLEHLGKGWILEYPWHHHWNNANRLFYPSWNRLQILQSGRLPGTNLTFCLNALCNLKWCNTTLLMAKVVSIFSQNEPFETIFVGSRLKLKFTVKTRNTFHRFWRLLLCPQNRNFI